jgi:hypothetical protein
VPAEVAPGPCPIETAVMGKERSESGMVNGAEILIRLANWDANDNARAKLSPTTTDGWEGQDDDGELTPATTGVNNPPQHSNTTNTAMHHTTCRTFDVVDVVMSSPPEGEEEEGAGEG